MIAFLAYGVKIYTRGGEQDLGGICHDVQRPCAVLQAAEHDLDPVAAFVAALVLSDGWGYRA